MKKTTALMTVAALAGVSLSASADVATFTATETVAGSWDIFVQITGGDSTGVGSYGFNVVDLADSSTASYTQNTLSTLNNSFQNVGFTNAPLQSPVGPNAYSVSNSQSGSANAIFGVGIYPIFVDGLDAASAPDINLGVPAFLGTLTTPEVLGAANFQFTTTIFDETGTPGFTNLMPANEFTIESVVNPVPEPTSLALLGLGGLLVARRRRA